MEDQSDDAENERVHHILDDTRPSDSSDEDDVDDQHMHSNNLRRNNMKWKEITPTLANTHLTMNKASTDAWNVAQIEIQHLQSRLMTLCNKQNLQAITEEDIVCLFSGPLEPLTTTIMSHLNLQYSDYCGFMVRLCLLAVMKHSNTTTHLKL